jgi:hypothetical protein
MPAVSFVSFVVKLLFDRQGHQGHNVKNQRVDLQVMQRYFKGKRLSAPSVPNRLKTCRACGEGAI